MDATQDKIKSLAVLPLKKLSGDSAEEYFADGMTEAIIGRLSMIRGLRVTLPAFILGQTVAMYTNTHNLPYWLKIAHAILSESAKFG